MTIMDILADALIAMLVGLGMALALELFLDFLDR